MTTPTALTGVTLQTLARGVSSRLGELVLSTPTASGTTTTLIDTALNQQFPVNNGQANWWVYGSPTADTLNRGVERRCRSWACDSSTLTFYTGGAAWPTAPTSAGIYEIRTRNSHDRVVQAITEATQMLAMEWHRDIQDSSITTAAKTLEYTLPASANWAAVNLVELQISTDPTYTGFPYVNAQNYGLNWKAEWKTDLTGTEVWTIQFGMQPPPGRILRVTGNGYFPAPVLETDVVPISGQWYGSALAFLYAYSTFALTDWTANLIPGGEVQRYQGRASTLRNWADKLRLDMGQSYGNAPVNVPGRGDGNLSVTLNDPNWFGANNTP